MRVVARKTCCMLWLMNMTATPRSARLRTNCSTCIDWRTPSAAAGSSRMTMCRPQWIARATAIICRCPPESAETGRRGLTSRPNPERILRVSRYIARRFVQESARAHLPWTSSRLRKKFCATSSVSTSERFWCTVSIPSERAESASRLRRSSPSTRISPASARCTPAMHLTSVDFPAPLSPTSPSTSPA